MSAVPAPTAGEELPYGVAPEGRRLPHGTRVGAVRLAVGDLQRSLEWYTRVLGLEVLRRTYAPAGRDGGNDVEAPARAEGSGPWAGLGPPGGPVLVELFEHPGARPVRRFGRLGLFHFALLVPGRDALGRLLRHMGDLGEPVGASDHLVSEALYLYDPDGLGVEVYADRPRDAWRHRGRELVMATEPLDAAGVVAAAGGSPWTGMPEGTVVGHVHLHVGDLAEAERFYHHGLGLDRMVWSYPGALFLAAGGYHHHLGVNSWNAGAPPPSEDEARLLEWELVLPTAEDVRRVVRSVEGPERDEGRVVDPWGTPLRIRPER